MSIKKSYLLALFAFQIAFSQGGLPVYTDYLNDNYYLVHPSMAGAANCGKIRLTARQQWFGVEDAPSLQTLSFNTKVGEGEQSGIGFIAFNDKNGYHSQLGGKISYAHHLELSSRSRNVNRLSLGINAGFVQNRLDERSFVPESGGVVNGEINKGSFFNADIGASYFYSEFYTHFTIQNLTASKRSIYSDFESSNLRRYLISAGYVFGAKDPLQWEPSVLFQVLEQSQEKSFDINLKVYKDMSFGKLWGGISYRRALEGAHNGQSDQYMQYFTPILGVNYKRFMFAYNYSHLTGEQRFDSGGFHQITIGFNIFCRAEQFKCNCPAIN